MNVEKENKYTTNLKSIKIFIVHKYNSKYTRSNSDEQEMIYYISTLIIHLILIKVLFSHEF